MNCSSDAADIATAASTAANISILLLLLLTKASSAADSLIILIVVTAACSFGNSLMGVAVADAVIGVAATGSTTDRWNGSLVGTQLARSVSLCYKQTSSFVLTFAVTENCPEVEEAAPTFTWCVE